jgi:hypothetical protein
VIVMHAGSHRCRRAGSFCLPEHPRMQGLPNGRHVCEHKVAGLKSCLEPSPPISPLHSKCFARWGKNRNCDRLVRSYQIGRAKCITRKRRDEQETSEDVIVSGKLSAASRVCKAVCSMSTLCLLKTSMAPAAQLGHYRPCVSNSERIQHLSRWPLAHPSSAQTLVDYPLRC